MAVVCLVCVTRVSLDKACELLKFFTGLALGKSHGEALLKRPARHWVPELESLCALLAHSAIGHADETSWSIKSVWAFVSEHARLLFFCVSQDKGTLEKVPARGSLGGFFISDDVAA
ncbi:MAG TPA: hypothetical protein EYP14_05185 [Planctomycetaceae bacterium]|nr:hypothetical protein [Planctomycetaceae bacterium]